MKKKVVILGGSGIGMIAASIIDKKQDAEVIGFLNDSLPASALVGKYKKIEVVGNTDDLEQFLKREEVYVFVAYVGLLNEKKTYEKIMSLNIPKNRLYNVIDSTAVIPYEYCNVGSGILMAPYVQLSPDVSISDNCIMLANSFVGHDSFLDRFAHLATNSVVGANVHVGKGVHVGSNATIKEKINIGDYAVIGAGAVVVNDVPENSIVAGNPAKVLRMK